MAGGAVGSVAGPIGALLGSLVSGGIVCVYEMRDGQKLWTVLLDTEQILSHTDITDSTEEPLKHDTDLQYLLCELFESKLV